MRILVAAIGSHGDVHPFVGVGLELKRRGHEVTALLNETFRDLALRAGFGYLPLGTREQMLEMLRSPDMWRSSRTHRLRARFLPLPMRLTVETIEAGGFELVVAHPLLLGARVAEERGLAPLVTLLPSPAVLESAFETPRFDGDALVRALPRPLRRLALGFREWRMADRKLLGPVNRFRGKFGLQPLRRGVFRWRLSARRVIGLFPDWFAGEQPDWPPQARTSAFPLYDETEESALPPGLPEFLDAGDPPVVLAPGTAMLQNRDFFASSLAALARLGKRALLLAPDPSEVPSPLPESARAFPYVPFGSLLPRASAIAHHAGIGTCAQALAAGIPQLLKPVAYDQFDNADRVARLRCGVVLPHRRYDAASAERALRSLPGAAHGCAAAAARIRAEGGLARIADAVLEAVR